MRARDLVQKTDCNLITCDWPNRIQCTESGKRLAKGLLIFKRVSSEKMIQTLLITVRFSEIVAGCGCAFVLLSERVVCAGWMSASSTGLVQSGMDC